MKSQQNINNKQWNDQSEMMVQNKIVFGPPGEIVPNISLGQHVFENLQANGDKYLQVDIETGQHYTCRDILEKSVKIANIFKMYGINVEDRITIASENHSNFIPTACAIMYVGAAFAPMNPAYTERECRHMLEILKPRIVLVTHRTEAKFAKIVPTLSWAVKLIELDDSSLNKDVPTLKELMKGQDHVNSKNFVLVPIDDNRKRISAILSSSGTTGFPKGVSLSHRNMLTFLYNSRLPYSLTINPSSRVILFLPFFHGYGVGMILLLLTIGASVYVMKSFDVETMLKSIEKYRITNVPVVPPILAVLAKHPRITEFDLSSVRELVCGAAPLSKDVAEEVRKRLKLEYIRNGYGMTELTMISHVSDQNSGRETVGRLYPGFLCKIIDQNTGEILDVGQIGEVCLKGDQVMLGYFQNPEMTADTIDKDNWLHTGDLGYHDERGLLYITGRLKELIKYKGFQVSPSEIESLILSHPEVKDVAVTGKPDEVNGEVPLALVVKQPGSNVTADDITELVKKNFSPQKWLRGGVYFIQAIPKTASGKIMRQELINLLPKL